MWATENIRKFQTICHFSAQQFHKLNNFQSTKKGKSKENRTTNITNSKIHRGDLMTQTNRGSISRMASIISFFVI